MSTSGWRAAFVPVLGIAVLSGCGGGGSTPNPTDANFGTRSHTGTLTASSRPGGAEAPTSAAQDKCRIVSATALTAAVGGKLVVETSGLSGVGNPVCMFELTKTSTHKDIRVLLSSNQSGNRAAFRSTKDRTHGARTITGLGDAAFFVKATSTLQVRTGAQIVIIQATPRVAGSPGVVPLTGQAVLVKIAKAVLAQ